MTNEPFGYAISLWLSDPIKNAALCVRCNNFRLVEKKKRRDEKATGWDREYPVCLCAFFFLIEYEPHCGGDIATSAARNAPQMNPPASMPVVADLTGGRGVGSSSA